MTENAKTPTAQNTIQDPPEYNAKNAKNPKEGSDWLEGPQNGNETLNESGYTKHRFSEAPSGSDWLGGPQNGNETPSEKKAPKGSLGGDQARNPQTGE